MTLERATVQRNTSVSVVKDMVVCGEKLLAIPVRRSGCDGLVARSASTNEGGRSEDGSDLVMLSIRLIGPRITMLRLSLYFMTCNKTSLTEVHLFVLLLCGPSFIPAFCQSLMRDIRQLGPRPKHLGVTQHHYNKQVMLMHSMVSSVTTQVWWHISCPTVVCACMHTPAATHYS